MFNAFYDAVCLVMLQLCGAVAMSAHIRQLVYCTLTESGPIVWLTSTNIVSIS